MRGAAAETTYQHGLFSTIHSSFTSLEGEYTLRAVFKEQPGSGNSSSENQRSAASPFFSPLITDWPLERYSLWYSCQVAVVEPTACFGGRPPATCFQSLI